jgi:hypothetical protein
MVKINVTIVFWPETGTTQGAAPSLRILASVRSWLVYYDSKDPTWNALEDLSAKGREDEDWACIFLLLIATFSAFLFYAKTLSPSRKGTP